MYASIPDVLNLITVIWQFCGRRQCGRCWTFIRVGAVRRNAGGQSSTREYEAGAECQYVTKLRHRREARTPATAARGQRRHRAGADSTSRSPPLRTSLLPASQVRSASATSQE